MKPASLKKLSQTQHGKIYETACFKDGAYFFEKEKYQGKRKLALFDLDNTILSYRHTLGTDEWFDFDFNEFVRQGLSAVEAKKFTLDFYLSLVKKIHPDDIYAVEEDTPSVIRKFQDQGIETLLLTSRGNYLLAETLEQLKRFEINFNQGQYKNKEKSLPQSQKGLFTQGMILTDAQNKGECFFFAIENCGKKPDLIVMWDDKLHNLEKVRDAIERYNLSAGDSPIHFIGLRYSKLDHVVKNVKSEVVELQKKYHHRILSNEHALAILKAENKKHRMDYVDIDYQPKRNSVVLSVSKHRVYELLRDLCPVIDKHRIIGEVKTFHGKEKLAWQFKMTVKEFQPLFHQLSQHGLIANDQFDILSPVFNEARPVLARVYDLRSRHKHQAAVSQGWQKGGYQKKSTTSCREGSPFK